MAEEKKEIKARVKILSPEVARKIAAGEVIDRPNAIVRELMDNAVDSGADKIRVEIEGGGIEKIRVIDNGCGMTKEDLENCAHPHATSKISNENDLLSLKTLGFRGEALSSMAAVSRLEIISGGYRMKSSITEDHVIKPCAKNEGTIVETSALFENFPARRLFLKRPASEGNLCRSTFEEKVLPRPDISFSFIVDGEEKLSLQKGVSLKERFVQTMEFFENADFFHEIKGKDDEGKWDFTLVIGSPSASRNDRKNIFIYVNGRKIQEYSLVQAIEYGCQGFFPNGSHPLACLFVNMDPSLVDFNIHPAKKEARFKDIASLHHGVSSVTRAFFKNWSVKNIIENNEEKSQNIEPSYAELNFSSSSKDDWKNSKDSLSSIEGFYSPLENIKTYSSSSLHSSHLVLGKEDSKRNYAKEILESLENDSSNQEKKYENSESEEERERERERERETDFKKNYISDKEEEKDGFHFIGLALGTFLIAEKNSVLYIIDQHAAHEREIYDDIMEKCGEKQKLLVPYIIQTENEADDNFIRAIKEKLDLSGFEVIEKGNGCWEFYSVPVRWKGSQEDLKKDLLDKRIDPHDMINSVAASTACRRAVMDGTVLDTDKGREIAKRALELPDPHCPHGRPVYTKITREQLFSLVKRT